MKLFVFSLERIPGGRVRRRADLYGWMLNVVGLIYLGQFLSLYQLPVLLEYLVVGSVFGAMSGLVVVVRRERRTGELPPEQVRDIQIACTAAGIGLMALAIVVQIAINVLTTL